MMRSSVSGVCEGEWRVFIWRGGGLLRRGVRGGGVEEEEEEEEEEAIGSGFEKVGWEGGSCPCG